MRPNVVYIVVDSIVGVQFRPGLFNSNTGFKGVRNTDQH